MTTPHIVYISSAYIGVGVVITALILVTLIDARIQKKRLKALERSQTQQ